MYYHILVHALWRKPILSFIQFTRTKFSRNGLALDWALGRSRHPRRHSAPPNRVMDTWGNRTTIPRSPMINRIMDTWGNRTTIPRSPMIPVLFSTTDVLGRRRHTASSTRFLRFGRTVLDRALGRRCHSHRYCPALTRPPRTYTVRSNDHINFTTITG